jgi:LmbE family N-acetylglucosaminyl deacetylase
LVPWLIAAGALAAAVVVWRRTQTPYFPDIAMHARAELLSRPRRVLAIGPHPGDLECFVGGTLKLLSLNGSAITMAILTRGEAATNRANIAEIRSREAEQGATILGAHLIQLDLPDGQLGQGALLDRALDDLWEQTVPDVVLAFDPKGPLPAGVNPDHLALGAAVLDRVRRSMATEQRVYYYGTPQPNVLIDITEVLQEKTNSLRAHRSQLIGPDKLVVAWTKGVSRLYRSRTPAMYAEALYRLV